MHDSPLTAVFTTMRICLHALVIALAAVVAVRAAVGDQAHSALVIALTVIWVAWYAAGMLLRGRPGWVPAWLAGLSVAWIVLLTLTPEASYLAFPLFFLYLHLLPRTVGLVAVVAATLASIIGFIMHSGFTAAAVIGPTLGAAVAVMIASGYSRLYAEVLDREQLIDELRETRAELAAQEHTAGVLAERERLAGDIHDTVAQSLSSIGMLIHAAQRDVDGQAHSSLTLAGQATAEALRETRALIDDLSPAPLQEHSLAAALERLTSATARHSIAASFSVDGDQNRLPMPVEAALVRITQSTLANVVQHARASTVHVTLTYAPDSVHLDVADDGIGFDAHDPLDRAAPGSAGLGFIARRTADLGGEFNIDSEPGSTVVAVRFPLDMESTQ